MLTKEPQISRIEVVHEKDMLMRDIKPENYVLGRNENADVIYPIDFGMAKTFRDRQTKSHVLFDTDVPFCGNVGYSSLNCDLGHAPSRRDDVEAICYTWIYLLRGSLWHGLKQKPTSAEIKNIPRKSVQRPSKSYARDFRR